MEFKKIILLILRTTILVSFLVLFLMAVQQSYLLLFELFGARYGGKGMSILGIIIMVPPLVLAIILLGTLLYLFGPKTKDNWILTIKNSKEYKGKLPLMGFFINRNKYIIFCILGLIGGIGVLIASYFIYLLFSSLLGGFLLFNSILGDSTINYSELFIILGKTLCSGFIGIGLLYITIFYYYNYRRFNHII